MNVINKQCEIQKKSELDGSHMLGFPQYDISYLFKYIPFGSCWLSQGWLENCTKEKKTHKYICVPSELSIISVWLDLTRGKKEMRTKQEVKNVYVASTKSNKNIGKTLDAWYKETF